MFVTSRMNNGSPPGKRCYTPEFISCKNDPALQEQRGEDPKEEAQAQRGKEAFKVDMFQSGIRRPAQLYHLQGETANN